MEKIYNLEAIILAGGKGRRLKSVITDLPKPMAPVSNKPFLEYILKHLQKNGITRVMLSVGYKWESIQDYFGNKYENIELIYSVEEEPLGTGGAIKKAISQTNANEVYVINGDTFFNVNFKTLSLRNGSKLMLSLKLMKKIDRYGSVESDENNQVTAFNTKDYKETGNINGGIYLISKNIFDDYDLDKTFSFEDFIQLHFKELKTSVKIFESYFIDIGIPDDYEKAQIEIENYI